MAVWQAIISPPFIPGWLISVTSYPSLFPTGGPGLESRCSLRSCCHFFHPRPTLCRNEEWFRPWDTEQWLQSQRNKFFILTLTNGEPQKCFCFTLLYTFYELHHRPCNINETFVIVDVNSDLICSVFILVESLYVVWYTIKWIVEYNNEETGVGKSTENSHGVSIILEYW